MVDDRFTAERAVAVNPGRARSSTPLTTDEALAVVQANWVSLNRLAAGMLRDRHAAQDAVQEAFIAIIRREPVFADEDGALRYARTVVMNGCRSSVRRTITARRHLQRVRLTHEPGAEDVAVENEAGRRALDILATLPHRQREVLTLRYLADLDDREIGEILGISHGTVRSNASRALATLSKRLKGDPR